MISRSPRPNRIGQLQVKVLLPQRSEEFALRRGSDSSSSEVRALDTLDRYRSKHVGPSTLHQVDRASDSGSGAEISSEGSIEQHLTQSVNVRAETELTTPKTRPELTSRNTTGQFIFPDEQTSDRNVARSESGDNLCQNLLLQISRTNEPALGTRVLAAKMNPLPIPEPMLARREDINPISNTIPDPANILPPPASLKVPNAQQQTALDSIQRVARASNLSIPVALPLAEPRKPTKRRRVIQRARKIVLRRRVLSLLLGRDVAKIVHPSLDVANGITQPVRIPNLDGTMSSPMGSMTQVVVAQIVSTSSDSPLSTPPMCSRRNSQLPPMDLDGRTYEQMQLPPKQPRTASKTKPKAFARKAQSQILVGKVKSLKAGKKSKPVPGHPPGSLVAGVHALKQRKSWRHKLRFRTPKVPALGSFFKKHRPEQRGRSWKFWKSKVHADGRDSHGRGSKDGANQPAA